jgi:multidrug efflux system outer membrane protein
MRRSSAAVGLIAIFSTGCTLGPNYHRPSVQTPDAFRSPTPVPNDPASLADLKWWEVFKDEQLQELERTALVQNYDLRDAVAHVDAARANLGITRSNQYPNFEADGSLSTVRLSRNGETPLPASFVPSQNRTFGSATLSLLSFELDIWGRLRRATEAARASLLSSEETRKAVITTLVSDVASAYLSLRTLDYQLDISERTLATRRASLELIKQRRVGGVATRLDVRQGEQLVYTATETIPTLQQQIEQTENQINLLLGKNPGEVKRGRSLTEQQLPDVPPGLPSTLLERRPDIRAAEQNLVAANAQIGVAKAA